jgi:hypothetical protein
MGGQSCSADGSGWGACACGASTSSGSSGSSSGSFLSCDLGSGCFTYSGGETPADCPEGNMVSSCPTANALGTCTIDKSTTTVAETFYSDGGITAAEAQMVCAESGGAWMAAM